MKQLAYLAGSAVLALGAATATSAQTAPETGAYGNLGYSLFDGGSNAEINSITGRLGYRFNRNLAVEGEGSLGVDSDKGNINGVPYRNKLSHSVGVYGVGILPVTPQLDLFVRGGYGASRIKSTVAGVSAADSEDSWNYGGGAQYSFDGKNGVRGDFTRHDFGNGFGHANVWSISYVRKF
jgi:hypothetical protein